MVSIERFKEVIAQSEEEGLEWELPLKPIQVTLFHGIIALAMKHPAVQRMNPLTLRLMAELRAWCLDRCQEMGFTPEEVVALDTGETEPQPKL